MRSRVSSIIKKAAHFLKTVFIFTLVLTWVFSGWPPIWMNPRIPVLPSNTYAANNDAMMVYDAQTITSTPKYRLWTGGSTNSWGNEASANAVNGEIKFMELKFCPTRDEAILVTQGTTGDVQAQVWTGGSTNSWGTVRLLDNVQVGALEDGAATVNNSELYRAFDVEYEQSSGDAVIVYGDGSADPDYQVWNGTSWSDNPVDIGIETTSAVNWIELASHPGTDRLALITLDEAADVYGMRWDGSTWDDMNASAVEGVWDNSAATQARKSVDVAFERTSGDIMFIWADGTQDNQGYRIYSQSEGTLGAVQALAITSQVGLGNWVQLATDPTASSDRLMYAVQDASSDLFSAYWDGGTWTVVPAAGHDTSVEDATTMNFDLVWETHSSNPNEAWLIWGDGGTVSVRHWNGSGWDAIASPANDDDTSFTRLGVQPNSGALLGFIYEDSSSATDNIEETHVTDGGTSWSNQAEIWTGPTVTNTATAAPGFGFRGSIAGEVYNSSTDAMMVYDTQTTVSTPKYRLWDGAGSTWGGESSANDVSGEIRFMELKFCPTRDEAILVTQGSTGDVQAQVWNGTSWGTVRLLDNVQVGALEDGAATVNESERTRAFDVEYEQSSGDAVIVYGDGSADPDYQVWNGTSWSDNPVDIGIETTSAVNWIELASHPGTDRLAMITLDQASDVYGMRWDGSTWDDMNASAVEGVWDASATTGIYRKGIDVAFETNSGDIMFIWGDGTATTQSTYRIYTQSTTTLEAAANLANSQQAGIVQWARLVADPTSDSNKLMYGEVDAGSDLNTYQYDGSSWSAVHGEHTAGIENLTNMSFDLAYETHSTRSGRAVIIFGNGSALARRTFDPVAGTWANFSTATSGDDTAFVRLEAQRDSGAVFGLAYDDSSSASDDIDELHLTGGGTSWSAHADIWAGPNVTNLATYGTCAGFRMAVASERYTIPAEVSIVLDTDGAVDYGIVPLSGEEDTTASGVNDTETARNNSTMAEDFNIMTSGAVGGTSWSVAGTAAPDVFVHSFSVNGGSSWEPLQTQDSYETLATNVVASSTEDFDLKIGMPTSTTDYQTKTITVTIQAVQHQ